MNITEHQIKERASDKAFANIQMCRIDCDRLTKEIKQGLYGGVTEEQMELMLRSQQIELRVWNYIAFLIEKDHKKTDYFKDYLND